MCMMSYMTPQVHVDVQVAWLYIKWRIYTHIPCIQMFYFYFYFFKTGQMHTMVSASTNTKQNLVSIHVFIIAAVIIAAVELNFRFIIAVPTDSQFQIHHRCSNRFWNDISHSGSSSPPALYFTQYAGPQTLSNLCLDLYLVIVWMKMLDESRESLEVFRSSLGC